MPFDDFLNGSCTIQALVTTINAMGEVVVSYTTGTAFACRKAPEIMAGEDVIANRVQDLDRDKFFLKGTVSVNETDRLISEGLTYNIVRVDSMPGLTGAIHHHEVITERAG